MSEATKPDQKKPLVTRMVAGKEIEVPLEECWDSICKVLRIARLLTCPGGEKHRDARLAFLAERLADIEALGFHYKRCPYSSNLREEFVP